MNDNFVDMHIHTNYSDGEYSPNEIINLAINKGLSVIAITDHDTIRGLKVIDRSKDKVKESGIKIIDGIELSAKTNKGRMHILGYGIDPNNYILNEKMSVLRDNSLNGVLSIMEQIKRDYGIRFKYDDIKDLVNSNHNLGRPDLAKLCVKYKYAQNIQDAFDKYLIDAYNKTRKEAKGLDFRECLDLILQSGGIPVLAHPKSLELDEKEFLIVLKDLIQNGLMGIEVYHSSHTKEEIEYYLKIAQEYNLLISGGSDYHGPTVKPNVKLGEVLNDKIKTRKLSILNHFFN